MKNYSNFYIFRFAAIMVILVATVLALIATALKPRQEKNIEIEKKKNILASVNIEVEKGEIEEAYDTYITETFAVNPQGMKLEGEDAFNMSLEKQLEKPKTQRKLPVYVCTLENGEKRFIFPVRGKGLWGPLWGFVSLESDFNTIFGVNFAHAGETPGLGAEINTEPFMKQFPGKKLFNEKGEFVSVEIIKGGAEPDNVHGVDGISGGTITSNGLESTISDSFKNYLNFIKKQK